MVLWYFNFGGMYTEFLIFLGGGEVKMGSVKEGNGSSSSAQGAQKWYTPLHLVVYDTSPKLSVELVYIWDAGEYVTR